MEMVVLSDPFVLVGVAVKSHLDLVPQVKVTTKRPAVVFARAAQELIDRNGAELEANRV